MICDEHVNAKCKVDRTPCESQLLRTYEIDIMQHWLWCKFLAAVKIFQETTQSYVDLNMRQIKIYIYTNSVSYFIEAPTPVRG